MALRSGSHANLSYGYDAGGLLAWLKERAIMGVIPARTNRIQPRECDWWLYKERHVAECMFGKLKHYRRVFCRYDKKMCNFMGMDIFAAILLGLR